MGHTLPEEFTNQEIDFNLSYDRVPEGKRSEVIDYDSPTKSIRTDLINEDTAKKDKSQKTKQNDPTPTKTTSSGGGSNQQLGTDPGDNIEMVRGKPRHVGPEPTVSVGPDTPSRSNAEIIADKKKKAKSKAKQAASSKPQQTNMGGTASGGGDMSTLKWAAVAVAALAGLAALGGD